MKVPKLLFIAFIACLSGSTASAQFKKLLQKAEQKVSSDLDKSVSGSQNQNQNSSTGSTPASNGTSGTSGSSNPSNIGGGGLISTPPDVKQNLDDAGKSFGTKSYGDARYSIQQAMLGVELEIGNQVLKGLPATVSGLNKVDKEDQVASTGFGWAGLTIIRKYNNGDDKQFTATIANNAAWMSAVNMYFNNGGYATQTGGQQNWKQTKLKGYRSIIEYSEGSGYKLSVPIGQSSLIVFDGVNFASEPDMMTAAGTFDIDGIKKQLGEQ